MIKNLYRSEIDGLRCIAVVAVVFGHFFPKIFPQGFLGVDVFFVISGYVISKLLISLDNSKSINFLLNFYSRRIKRILPALYTVTVMTFLISFLVLSRVDGYTSNTGKYSLLGLSNMYLWHISNDYFGLAAAQNPFTQTWSLSVEAQFYAIYPITFLISVKLLRLFNKTLVLVLFRLIILLSFIFYLCMLTIDHNFTFYSMPTRFWQFVIGSAALYFEKNSFAIFNKTINLRIVAFMSIIIPFFFPFENRVLSQFIVSVGTALFLYSNQTDHISAILTKKPMEFLGKRSYSIYLIHWPVLVFSNYLLGSASIKNILCLPLVLILGSICYKFIEVPFRNGVKLFKSSARIIILSLILVLTTVFVINYSSPILSQSENNLIPGIFKVSELPENLISDCSGKENIAKLNQPISNCLGGSPESNKPYVFVIGDSHADHLLPMVNLIFKNSQYQVKNLNLENGLDFPFSEIHNDSLSLSLVYLSKNSKIGDIVILSFHRGYLNEDRDQHIDVNQKINLNIKTQNLINNLDRFAKNMEIQGVKIVLVKDTPLMKSVQSSQSCALQLRLTGHDGCTVSKTQDSHTRFLQEYAFDSVSTLNKNVMTFDPFGQIYSKSDFFSVTDSEGFYTMQDWNHITQRMSRELGPSFKYELEAFLKQTIN